MKCRSALTRLILIACLAFAQAAAFAQVVPESLADFTWLSSPNSSDPQNFRRVGNITFFTAHNLNGGQDLWRTDATPNGTYLVKEINPYAGANPSYLGVAGNILYFVADDGAHGRELWRSDGTETGTFLVKDINPGAEDAFPWNAVINDTKAVLDGELYFQAYDGTHGTELWCTDGTSEGTRLVRDINAKGDAFDFTLIVDDTRKGVGNSANYSVHTTELPMVVSGGYIYFAADDGEHGIELWRSDGTLENTRLVADIREDSPNASGLPLGLTPFRSGVVFTADDGSHGREFWISDGRSTSLIADIVPGKKSSAGVSLEEHRRPLGAEMNDMFIFIAADPADTSEVSWDKKLWRTDGTPEGTQVIGPDWLKIENTGLDRAGGWIYFMGTRQPLSGDGNALWRTDGTNSGTVQLSGTAGRLDLTEIRSRFGASDSLYFTAVIASQEDERRLWRVGAETGDIVNLGLVDKSFSNSYLEYVQGTGNIVYASTPSGADTLKIWKTDGTAEGTRLLHANETTCRRNSGVVVHDDVLVFADCDLGWSPTFPSRSNVELWSFRDGRAAPLKELFAGDLEYGSAQVKAASGNYVWIAGIDADHRPGLWSWNRASGEITRLVSGEFGGALFEAVMEIVIDGVLYFSFNGDNRGTELWRSDGTPEGTFFIKDIVPGEGGSHPQAFAVMDGTLYFFAEIPDATVNAMERSIVKDVIESEVISPADKYPAIGQPINFQSPAMGLWRSDGTEAGTMLVTALTLPDRSGPRSLMSNAGTLFFPAKSPGYGVELWISDGTPSGTRLLVDILPGVGGSYPIHLTVFDGEVLFWANDGEAESLWKSDGSVAGTQRVKAVIPSTEACSRFWISSACWRPSRFMLMDDSRFYFTVEESVPIRILNGAPMPWQLWESNGSPEGTSLRMQAPFPSDAPVAAVHSMFSIGNTLHALGTTHNSRKQLLVRIEPEAGTFTAIKEFSSARVLSSVLAMKPDTPYRELLFLTASEWPQGQEVWVSNGTPDGTVLVADIAPGPASTDFSYTAPLFVDSDEVFFTAQTRAAGTRLWRMNLQEIQSAMPGASGVIVPAPLTTAPSAQEADEGGGSNNGLAIAWLVLLAAARSWTRNRKLRGLCVSHSQ